MPRKQPGPTTDRRRRTTAGDGSTDTPTPHRSSPAPHRSTAAPRRLRTAVRHWITGAPGTYIWLAVLFVTTVVLHRTSPAFEDALLRDRSANLHELAQHPVRVLISSILWIDGGRWLLYAVLFTVVHATAEHWLSTPRWLAVVVAAHVLATLAGQGALAWAVRHGDVPQSAANSLHVGVSYALAGVVAILAYRVPHPWRYVYVFAVLVFYGVPLVGDGRTFTDLGHVTAVLVGLACYPLTRTTAHERGETKRPAGQ